MGFVVAVEVAQDDAEVEAGGFAPGGHLCCLEVGERAAQGFFGLVPSVQGREVVAEVLAGHRQIEADEFG